MLCSCSDYWFVGDGRGDWSYEIISGYCVSKVNSKMIWITKKRPDDSGAIIIPQYFVVSFQVSEQYILIEGIHTEEKSISEDELNERNLNYYIISTKDDEIHGPFQTRTDFDNECQLLKIIVTDRWVLTKELKCGENYDFSK